MRHLEIKELWLQAEVREGRLIVTHIKGDGNTADLLTKQLPFKRLEQLTALIGLRPGGDEVTTCHEAA
eukprot:13015981-Heterocapsa_arctica.AAC.1